MHTIRHVVVYVHLILLYRFVYDANDIIPLKMIGMLLRINLRDQLDGF